jgi:long-chain acyl-CoA synthetase
MNSYDHIITPEQAGTLPQLLCERARRTPHGAAYRWCDPATQTWRDMTWQQVMREVARFRVALQREQLHAGQAVGIMLGNCREWVFMEQAAMALGLIVVPLFANDNAENAGYILHDADIQLLLINGDDHLKQLAPISNRLAGLRRIVTLQSGAAQSELSNLCALDAWLPADGPEFTPRAAQPNDLATIVYTSGTTGKPKGVMLSHRNILSNAYAGIRLVDVFPDDVFLSFLPLSHMLERTLGYYIPMMSGATMAFARSVPQLAEDMLIVRPTVLISVPRIYERVYARIQEQLAAKSPVARKLFDAAVSVGWTRFEYRQHRRAWTPALLWWPLLHALVARKIMAKLGGRIRVAVTGGAALAPHIGRTFLGLGLPLIQGYGLTETSPIISGNPPEDNVPESVGKPLHGVQVRVAENGELLTRGEHVMLGYWRNAPATRAVIDADGWLHSGDKVRVADSGHIFITGRLKEIIVLANGEKIAPADMEMAIIADPLFEQVMIVGEGRPYLAALVVLEATQWQTLAATLGVAADDPAATENKAVLDALLQRIGQRTAAFPGYTQIRRIAVTREPWTIDNGLITPTLKLRREQILARFQSQVQQLYAGH